MTKRRKEKNGRFLTALGCSRLKCRKKVASVASGFYTQGSRSLLEFLPGVTGRRQDGGLLTWPARLEEIIFIVRKEGSHKVAEPVLQVKKLNHYFYFYHSILPQVCLGAGKLWHESNMWPVRIFHVAHQC